MIFLNGSIYTSMTLNNSLSNLLISSQRLVTMSVSLHTRTVLRCLTIQVLHTRVWFLNIQYTSLTSVHSNSEHGLAILTASFSPLRPVLHNISCWSPKQKWCEKPHYSWYCLLDMHKKPVLTSSYLFKLTTATKIDMFKSQDVELIYVRFYFSDLDKPYTKTTSLMYRFQIWP